MIRRNGMSPHSIVDVGCGVGGVIGLIKETMPKTECYGYDISPQAIELCRRNYGARIAFSLGEMPDATFDLMLCLDVFEHVDDYIDFLRRLRRCATHAIFHIPLDMNVSAVLRGRPIQHARDVVGHLHYFSKETALSTLEYSGYRVRDHFYTSGFEYGKTFASKIALVPRRVLYAFAPNLAPRLLGGWSLMVLVDS
jgi:ubiquinone/menaquinone biosynthesis C-methylase UbiE